MYIFSSKWLRRGEAWFSRQEPTLPVDVVDYRQLPQPVPKAVSRPFYTYHIALDGAPDAIFARFNPTTRNEIRQARGKYGVTCRVSTSPTAADASVFIEAYNAFALAKQRPALNTDSFQRYLADQSLWLSFAHSPTGELLVAHGNYIGGGRMRALYAVSPLRGDPDPEIRRIIGRAGRFLNWTDMLAARDFGLRVFDFGGWYAGTADSERLSINAYKSCFGGEVVCEYNSQRAFTLKGYAALAAGKLRDYVARQRARGAARASVSAPPANVEPQPSTGN